MSPAPLDLALQNLAPYGPGLKNGLTNHAPMVAEALETLGRADQIQPWVVAELEHIERRQPAQQRINADRTDAAYWQDELGARERFTDWANFIAEQIAAYGWQCVLQTWAARLAPGFISAAAHCVIRVGHAARALSREQTEPRKQELADAIATWGSQYTTLPTIQESTSVAAAPTRPIQSAAADALARVALVDKHDHAPTGSITAAISHLADYPEFAGVVDWIDPEYHAAEDLAPLFARLFLQSANSAFSAIVFTHSITGLAAAYNIGQLVDTSCARLLMRYAWQSGCALHATYSKQAYQHITVNDPPAATDEIINTAVSNGDEHVIKLAEACIALHGLRADPHLLLAAQACAKMVPPRTPTPP